MCKGGAKRPNSMTSMTRTEKRPDPSGIRLLVFDLDGTLIDSKLDLALSINATRKEYGLDPLPHETIFGFIGDGARALIQRSLAEEGTEEQSDERVDEALRFFIRTYSEHALDNTVPYAGVREGLERLSGDGRTLTVLTNKPEQISRKILAGMDLERHFRAIYGGNSFDTKKPDPQGLIATLKEFGAAPREALVIGDSPIDVETARNAGAWVCGVSYGIASHELKDAEPDFCIESLEELAEWAGA